MTAHHPHPRARRARPLVALAAAFAACVGLACDDDAGVYGPRRCAVQADCLPGQLCELGRCVPGPDATPPDVGPDLALDFTFEPEPDLALDMAPDLALDMAPDLAVDAALDGPPADMPDLALDMEPEPDLALDMQPDLAVDAEVDLGPTECEPGTERVCNVPLGVCSIGQQTCERDGFWGPCRGAVLADDFEQCNGLDDDCDGRIDEGLVEACGADGACRPGRRTCAQGVWSACDESQAARPEICDGFDDDCDGRVDEDLVRPCSRDRGACRQGVQTCEGGLWGACVGGVLPGPETCDGVDQDCDGRIDEELFRACGGDPCDAEGIRLCLDGVFGPCLPQRPPVSETCDGRDNDCDARVDEGVIRSCGAVVGACRAGTTICVAGVFGECVGDIEPIDELCNDVDDDCDGVVDEEVPAAVCGSDEGRCVSGRRACVDGVFGPCVGEVAPAPERCDYEDNDCDGFVDERLPVRPELCNRIDDDCDGTVDESVPVSPEVCNAVDDDCDGTIDEGTEARDEICDGVDNDCDGRADEDVRPIPELCNAIDDDCDGTVDEDARPILCGTNVGECVAGIRRCVDGQPTAECEGSVDPIAELCDDLDNDCDGRFDEDVAGDRDDDGIGDCLETLLGLDPDDPRDAELDYDHDGAINRNEAVAGTPLWSTLFIVPAEPPPMADPDLVFVSLRLYQPDEPLRPELIEVFIEFSSPALVWVDAEIGAASFDADKEVFPNLAGANVLRLVILSAFNVNRIGSGELALLTFRRVLPGPVNLRIDRVRSRFAPEEADDALDVGTVEHRFPLTIP